ncbi:MAG: mevalonate kinase [Deltaproteobacteria bacterium]|nr:mevalonate kinase [Deltaproteobacteria bacterium]
MGGAALTAHEGAACGKVILLGEHAVVWGVPALAAGISLGATAIVEPADSAVSSLEIEGASSELPPQEAAAIQIALEALSTACGVTCPVRARVTLAIPVRAGLGSSAAIAVALARALFGRAGTTPSHEMLIDAASAWERVFHGNPSGIDVAAAVLGGVIHFERARGARSIPLSCPLSICIGLSGRRPSTRAMVDQVAQFASRKGGMGEQIFAEIRELVSAAEQALATGDLRALGKLMDMNHALLSSLSVSTDDLDGMCTAARRAGALGAKLTGAGGGGCVIALAPGCEQAVLEAWQGLGFPGLHATIA